jgi:hypothetical protein
MCHKSFLTFGLPLAALLVCAAARPAGAQSFGTGGTLGITGTGGTTGTTTFATSDFFVGVQETQGVNLSTFDAARFFDVARCQCATPVYLFIALLPSGFAKRSTAIAQTGNTGQISVWLGTNCDNATFQVQGLCRQIGHEPLLTFLNQGSWTIPTNAQDMSVYLGTSSVTADGGVTTTTTAGSFPPCTAPTGTFPQTVSVVVDTNGDGNSDLTIGQSLNVDLQPPPAPTGVTLQGGQQALIMKWDLVDQSVNTDLVGYQILCSRADKYQVFTESPVDGGGASGPFFSGFESCPKFQDGGAGGIEALDPTFICSGLLSPATNSYRIETLQNGIYYAAAVVAVDNSGNPSSSPKILYGKPVPTLSFYDVYRNGYADSNNTGGGPDPGAANGGFCAVAAPRPHWRSTTAALAGVGIVVAGVTFARRRRRGRR